MGRTLSEPGQRLGLLSCSVISRANVVFFIVPKNSRDSPFGQGLAAGDARKEKIYSPLLDFSLRAAS